MPISMRAGAAAGETAVAPGGKWAVLACVVMAGPHSTEHTSPFMHRCTHAALALALTLLGTALSTSALAATTEWPDVEGRIQYGFYTEGSRAVSAVVNQLSGPEDAENPLRHYYIGFANYRLSALLARKDK